MDLEIKSSGAAMAIAYFGGDILPSRRFIYWTSKVGVTGQTSNQKYKMAHLSCLSNQTNSPNPSSDKATAW